MEERDSKNDKVNLLEDMKRIPSALKLLSDLEFYDMRFFFYSGKTLRETGSAWSKLLALISPDLLAFKVFSFI